MVSRRVGRARCGESLMQGWGGRGSGRATHACPLRLPLSAGSLRLGCGRGKKKKVKSTAALKVLLENAVFGNALGGELNIALDVEHLDLLCESSR